MLRFLFAFPDQRLDFEEELVLDLLGGAGEDSPGMSPRVSPGQELLNHHGPTLLLALRGVLELLFPLENFVEHMPFALSRGHHLLKQQVLCSRWFSPGLPVWESLANQ